MCRLAFIPARTKISRKQLASFFNQLECSFGGDGNGYAAISPDGTVTIGKGVKMSTDQIAGEAIKLNRAGYAIYFHTRKISVGWSSNDQCHPFRIDGPSWDGSLCHNGTWTEGAPLAKYLCTGSDTATLAYLIGEIGLPEIKNRDLMPRSGIFLLYGGKPGEAKMHTVLNLGGSLEYCPKTGVWASEFFKDWPNYNLTYSVEQGAHMLEKPAPKSKRPVITTSYKGCGTGYSSSGTYYSTGTKYTPATPKVGEQQRYDQYWKDRGFDMDSELELAKTDEQLWGDRIFYHN